jgi:NADH dehydrogenase
MELSDIFAGRKVNVILDNIKNIDFENKVVSSADEQYPYDYLVIASGCKPTFFGTKGARFTHQLWSYQDAVNLKEQILYSFRKAACTKSKEERLKTLSFSIVGSGFTGVEMAGELGEYKDELCQKFNISATEVTINLIDIVEHVLPKYPDKLVKKVEKRLAKLGVTILCGEAVKEVGKDFVVVGDKKMDSHTTIWAAGVEGSELVNKTKKLKKQGRGRFETNKYLQSTKYDNVYIAGDNIYYIPENHDEPVLQMVENAEHSAKTISHNIVKCVNGASDNLEEYKPKFNGTMVCVGGKYGVAYIGSKPEKMKSFSGFIAMFIKHFINFIYFINVMGLHKCYAYAKHEFFTVRNKRSFVGGHFSNSTNAPTIFLVPLRIFLGVMWLASGIGKLPDVIANKITTFPSKAVRYGMNISDGASSASQAVDTATSATQLTDATSSGTQAGGQAVEAAKQGFDAFADGLNQYFHLKSDQGIPTIKFFDGIMNWVFETFMWDGNNGFTALASIFQSGMVIAEIGIGLMFIVGFLTPLAAIIGFVMMIMIWMSGWSYMSIIFFGFAGLACIFAGNAFGLDYYVLPWLDKKLRKFKLTRKLYLYFK